MKIGRKLFQRFGLFAPKSPTHDAFDLRLQRIGLREQRLSQRLSLFRTSPLPEAV